MKIDDQRMESREDREREKDDGQDNVEDIEDEQQATPEDEILLLDHLEVAKIDCTVNVQIISRKKTRQTGAQETD